MDRYKLDLVSAGRDFNKIRMAVTSGFFFHAARKDPQARPYHFITDCTLRLCRTVWRAVTS